MTDLSGHPTQILRASGVEGRFMRRYSGRNARHYETRRQGPQWEAEAQAFRQLYKRVSPRSILDCPIGTGRWLGTYQRTGASVLGIDLSDDMLTEPAKKLRPNAGVRLERGDLMNPSRPAALGSGHELIVCTRFAHWLSPQDLTVLFGRFSATGSRYLLLGAMVRPRRRVQPNPSQKGWRDHLKSLRTWLRPRPPEYVHDEAFMLQALRECRWTLTARTPVSRSRGVHYYFYLLAGRGANGAEPGRTQSCLRAGGKLDSD